MKKKINWFKKFLTISFIIFMGLYISSISGFYEAKLSNKVALTDEAIKEFENDRIGGKTGTAQTVENGRYSSSKYILSFIGFMPANDPEIIVYVAVENAKGVVQYGGTVAAPIARNIFLSAIDILDIKPDTEGIPKEYTWLDQKYVIVPDVVGMTIDEAKKVLKGFNIEYSGNGETVIYESPKGGMYVKEKGTVVLMLG